MPQTASGHLCSSVHPNDLRRSRRRAPDDRTTAPRLGAEQPAVPAATVCTTRLTCVRLWDYSERDSQEVLALRSKGDDQMLATIAAVLIVLWLLGFFAFHITAAFIHVALVVGLILLVLHFVRR
jgi:hypothetical protein